MVQKPLIKQGYSLAEEIANSVSHGIGLVFGIVGLVLLLVQAVDLNASATAITSYSLYGGSMILLFLASTLYHAIPHQRAKMWLKKFDHCAIYLLIAGTYTPFLLVGLDSPLARGLMIVIWSLALLGILFKLTIAHRFKILSLVTYLAMGWLSLVVTSKARNKIKSYLREEQAKHTRMGREELERKLKNWKFAITIDEAVAYLAKYFKLRLGTEVYALIATQKLDFGSIKEILSRHLSGEAEEERRAAAAEIERQKAALHGTQEKAAPQDALVIDDDISKIQYKLAKCCNPIKGDEVFGFVTINSGITIHRCDCPNAKRMRENYPYRVIDARWRQSAEGAFRVTIRIVAADTTGMANHITEVIVRDLKLGIRSMNFAPAGNGCVAGEVAVEVPGTAVVDTLIHQIMRIKGVQRAYRVN